MYFCANLKMCTNVYNGFVYTEISYFCLVTALTKLSCYPAKPGSIPLTYKFKRYLVKLVVAHLFLGVASLASRRPVFEGTGRVMKNSPKPFKGLNLKMKSM